MALLVIEFQIQEYKIVPPSFYKLNQFSVIVFTLLIDFKPITEHSTHFLGMNFLGGHR